MKRVVLLCAALSLSACAAANDAADRVARDQAKTVVNGVVKERFPLVNAAPITDCVIDAARSDEILSIAGASVTGVTQKTVEKVWEVGQRPDAMQCYKKNSIALLGL